MRTALIVLLMLILFTSVSLSAQTQCGYADALDFPVDPARFVMTQDFGAPSTRHQGRYHTGEDWYGGLSSSLGEPVRAVADGRVTFSSPNGWGVDGGVIIVEHTFRDESVAYSMVGHLTDQTGIAFPPVFSCVRRGDVLAAIGDARPAPHLHFEMRINQPDIPGAGYTFEDPTALGHRRPTKFILNFGARAADGFLFAADIADETGSIAAPILFSTGDMIALDANRALGISLDGRVLWRVALEREAVGLVPDVNSPNDGALIVYADGGVGRIGADGARGVSRDTGVPVSAAPLIDNERIVMPTPDGGLVAFDLGLTAPLWTRPDVGNPVRLALTDALVGVIADDGRIITLDVVTGAVLDTAMLREPGALAAAPSGDLLVYARGGLWAIEPGGEWRLRREDAPPGGAGAALLETADGTLYAFDGAALRAYPPDGGGALWESALPGMTGVSALAAYPVGDGNDSRIVLLTSSYGDVIAVQASGGGVCNRIRVYGDARSRVWADVGTADDGVLRIHAADQVIGYDWRTFLGACG